MTDPLSNTYCNPYFQVSCFNDAKYTLDIGCRALICDLDILPTNFSILVGLKWCKYVMSKQALVNLPLTETRHEMFLFYLHDFDNSAKYINSILHRFGNLLSYKIILH